MAYFFFSDRSPWKAAVNLVLMSTSPAFSSTCMPSFFSRTNCACLMALAARDVAAMRALLRREATETGVLECHRRGLPGRTGVLNGIQISASISCCTERTPATTVAGSPAESLGRGSPPPKRLAAGRSCDRARHTSEVGAQEHASAILPGVTATSRTSSTTSGGGVVVVGSAHGMGRGGGVRSPPRSEYASS